MTELRLHPRIPATLLAEITNSNGDSMTTQVCNMSPGGLMLSGTEELKELVFTGHEPDKDPLFHPVEIEIRIQLPGQQQQFYSRARLLYIRRLSQHQFNLGFRYVAISSIHASMMERHIFAGESTKDALNRAFGQL